MATDPMPLRRSFAATLILATTLSAGLTDKEPPAAPNSEAGFSVRLIDEAGQPVTGAEAGLSYHFDSRDNNETPQTYDDPSLRGAGTRALTPTPRMACARPKELVAADAGLSRAPASSAVLIKVMAAIGGSTAYFVLT